ncbi:THO complex subunit 7 homolog [Ochotona curzoniae]|uniref:THO complex subunit 7 homolog n=1 Tax=Ochotona curzoniae TaxID=130825 RepID=UPI001B34EF16|nr:THO complex subunit 7 homolog [Ochotona curzoniae]
MGSVSDDDIIRKRLLIDGDGAGDDRRLNVLVRSFVRWCAGPQDEAHGQYQRLLGTLAQCEFSMGKALLVHGMNRRERDNYDRIYREIQENIAGAHESIVACKKRIAEARQIRKHRQEYDALARAIEQHPERQDTLRRLEALGRELEQLSHVRGSVEEKLQLRRKQFHALLSNIYELQQTLENDEKLPEGEARRPSGEGAPKG